MKFKRIFAILVFAPLTMPIQAMWATRLAQSLGRTLSKTHTTAFRSLATKRQPVINQRLSTPLSRMRSTPTACRYRFTFSTPWQRATFFAASTAAATHIGNSIPTKEQKPLAESAHKIPEKKLRRYLQKQGKEIFQNAKNEMAQCLAYVYATSKKAPKETRNLVLQTSKEMGIDPRCVIVRINNAPQDFTDVSTAYAIEPEHILGRTLKAHVDNIRQKTQNSRLYIVILSDEIKKYPLSQQKFIAGHELMHAHLGHTKRYALLTEAPEDKACMRSWEKEADIQAARKLQCAQAAINNFTTYLSAQEIADMERGNIKRAQPDSSHPTMEERIAYLQPIAQEQAKIQALRSRLQS